MAMTSDEAELLEAVKRGDPGAIAKANAVFDRSMTMSKFRDFMGKVMVDFVHRHCGKPIEQLRSDVDEQNAVVAGLLRRVAALEAKQNG